MLCWFVCCYGEAQLSAALSLKQSSLWFTFLGGVRIVHGVTRQVRRCINCCYMGRYMSGFDLIRITLLPHDVENIGMSKTFPGLLVSLQIYKLDGICSLHPCSSQLISRSD